MTLRRRLRKLVENVEIPFIQNLAHHPTLLQQIIIDIRAYRLALRVELNLQVLPKPRRIIIPQRLRVSKGLEQWIRRQDHVLDLLDGGVGAAGDIGDVLHYPLCGFGLPGATFTRDDDALVLSVGLHIVVGGFSDGEDVRGHFEAVLPAVAVEDGVCVDSHCTPLAVFPCEMQVNRGTHNL
jgi:hypothetical protein